MVHYVVAIVIATAGMILIGYELFTFMDWIGSDTVQAVVVDVVAKFRGKLVYTYEAKIDGFVKQLTQEVYVLNPLKYVFPKLDIGKRVNIKYNRRKECLFQHPSFGIIYFVTGLILLVVGLMMLAIFWLVP